jgi:predicted metal-dependent hydrolase
MNWLSKLGALTQIPLFAPDDQPDAMVVRVSARARRMTLRVYPAGRIEVVVPPKTPARFIQEFVARNRTWLDQRLRECQQQRAMVSLPDELLLPALERRLQLQARAEAGAVRVRALGEHHLLLRGEMHDTRRWSRSLAQWLCALAEREFEPRLRHLAALHGFSFDRLQIRRQRTRWGSCSSSGTISLNVCALFVGPDVLRYLMIHELSHTRHMNHSARFWACVEGCEPNWRELDKELTQAWRHVPAWMFLGK